MRKLKLSAIKGTMVVSEGEILSEVWLNGERLDRVRYVRCMDGIVCEDEKDAKIWERVMKGRQVSKT